MNNQSVLIVGGYGAVGRQIAQILHDRHPDLHILLGGRTPNMISPFKSPRIKTIIINSNWEDPLQNVNENVSLVINSVNDIHDRILLAAVSRKIPFIDITRWTELFEQAIRSLKHSKLYAPVVLSSGWMAGTSALIATLFSSSLTHVSINIQALYSLQDKAGPDSADYMDRMSIPFIITEPSGRRQVYPMSEPNKVTFPNGYTTKCYRLDTPDHVTLPSNDHIDASSFRISFDSKVSTLSLVAMVNSGIWRLISGQRFRSLRRSLLYKPGSGSAHQIMIEINGRNQKKQTIKRSIAIIDPLGQTHLTALGAVIQAEKILRAQSKNYQLPPGIYYPEQLPDKHFEPSLIIDFYKQYGVTIIATES
ncbi:MAG: saccharopine dehydrogenase [Candidatus Pristimantibacillus lignocellulolyticus]|uniref:Saccharopine dehydrogenase n=1 Tax=Candidatus Pristimantibacillus lignocellulolyticus TaxID=2994561 RepID=A0A9J6ZGK0_9BACL|nr:MAG: saccharopine dehydrogenase [Candidatus Pristimantibacillus lignocellulolyticus]